MRRTFVRPILVFLVLAVWFSSGCMPLQDSTTVQGDAAPQPIPMASEIATDKIANALTAGPSSVTDHAAILDWPSENSPEMQELRAGTNGWTCLPDDPNSPANDPVCFDEAWMDWVAAFATGQEPETTSLGFSYMLQGGSAISDADPYAEFEGGEEWLTDPPHLMVLVPSGMDLSRFPTDRESGEPYVMWAGTPYEHFMIPLDNLDATE